MNSPNLCDFQGDKKLLNLLIVIESKADHFAQRNTIRKTWGIRALQEALNFRILFILSIPNNRSSFLNTSNSRLVIEEKIVEEYWTYNDILLINKLERYDNIAYKSIAMLEWSLKHCSNFDYLFKSDDDLLIFVPNLIKFLNQFNLNNKHNVKDSTIICHENRIRIIIRTSLPQSSLLSSRSLSSRIINSGNRFNPQITNYLNKYLVNNYSLPGKYYPRYCSGFGYAFNRKVAESLLNSISITPYYFIEDVFITGFCRSKSRVNIVNSSKLYLSPPVSLDGVCEFLVDGRINSHEMTVGDVEHLWNSLNRRGYQCPKLIA